MVNEKAHLEKNANDLSWLWFPIPIHSLHKLLEPKIYNATLLLPQIQKLITSLKAKSSQGFRPTFLKLGIVITSDTVPLIITLFQASSYINGK